MGARSFVLLSLAVLLAVLLTDSGRRLSPRSAASFPYPPDLLEREIKVRELYSVAEDHLNERDFEGARSALLSIISLDPHHPLAFLGAVLIEHRRDTLHAAEGALETLSPTGGPGLLYGLGTLYFLEGRNARAERLLGQALQGYAALSHPAGEAASRTGLGNVFLRASRYEEALAAYGAAARIVEELGDPKGLADVLNNLGNVLQLKGDENAALAHYQRALEIRETLNDRKGIALAQHNLGLIRRYQGDASGALALFERSLAIHKALGDREGEVNNINAIGLARLDLGQDEEATKAFRESLDLARKLEERRAEANALTNLASIDLESGRLQDALDRHLEALSIRRRLGDRAGAAASLNNAASAREIMGFKQEALRLYEASLVIHRELGDLRSEAIVLTNLGRIRSEMGPKAEGIAKLREAMEIYRILGDAKGESSVQVELGKALMAAADYPAALDSLRRALEVQRRIGDHEGEAASLDSLGVLLSHWAEFDEAQLRLEEALLIEQKRGDRRAEAHTRNNLANVHFARGEFIEALRQQERSLALRRSLRDLSNEAADLGNIGAIYQAIGDAKTAMRYIRDSLEQTRQLSNRAGEALILANLGVVLQDMGDFEGALREYRQSILILDAMGDHRGAAFSRHNLASVLGLLGRLDEAQQVLDRALSAFRDTGDRAGQALVLAGMGDLMLKQGTLQVAETRYSEALEIAAASGMREEIWRAEAGIAACREAAGRWMEALNAYEGAMAGIESVRSALVSEEFKSRFLAGRLDPYEKAVRLLWRHGRPALGMDAARRAFEYAERARARALLDLLTEARSDLRRHVEPALVRREAMLLARTAQVERDLGRSQEHSEREALKRSLERVDEELNLLKVEFRRASPRYAEIVYPEPSAADEVGSRLVRQDEILLEYLLGEQASYLWVVSREGVFWRELPSRAAIESAVRHFLELIRSQSADLGPDPAYRRWARDLGRMLLPPGPVPPDSQLLIVPDGILHYLPFEALVPPWPTSGKENALLIESHEVAYAPSASSLRLLRASDTANKGASRKILAVGGAAVKLEADVPWDISPLPFAREEVLRIGGLFPEADRSVLLGEEATEAAVKAFDLKSIKYLHFAAHGWIDEESPGRSGLVIGSEGGSSVDGLLRMNEVFTLRTSAELVVLSSCRTGLGRLVRGEGLVGFTRAFMYAGARSVVVSLWNVDDRSTADLMEVFYRGLVSGASPRAALRGAKLALLRGDGATSRHPSRWAPFILIGDPGEVANEPPSGRPRH